MEEVSQADIKELFEIAKLLHFGVRDLDNATEHFINKNVWNDLRRFPTRKQSPLVKAYAPAVLLALRHIEAYNHHKTMGKAALLHFVSNPPD